MMKKAEMMKSLKERRADPKGTSSSRRSSKGKRKASSEGGERLKKHHNEEKATEPARATAPKDPVNEPVGTTEKIPEQQYAEVPYVLLDTSAISFVAKPFGSVSLDFICRLVPDQDFDLMKRTPDLEVLKAACLHFMQVQSIEARAQHSEEENHILKAEVEKLQGEAANSWQLEKEKANGYSEKEHPTSFSTLNKLWRIVLSNGPACPVSARPTVGRLQTGQGGLDRQLAGP
ncbi:protein REVEILLE 4 [Dorcoceras hygrometricum]|uniref:Protein REVEILLE 4 n=1 Tax=Dorcoceras hygrometricum TaxID=472368 RepID=A0A2Z7AGE4_9LAMI|nr:protein REVEILLE 4 [Dorcoceras hygrometricum]